MGRARKLVVSSLRCISSQHRWHITAVDILYSRSVRVFLGDVKYDLSRTYLKAPRTRQHNGTQGGKGLISVEMRLLNHSRTFSRAIVTSSTTRNCQGWGPVPWFYFLLWDLILFAGPKISVFSDAYYVKKASWTSSTCVHLPTTSRSFSASRALPFYVAVEGCSYVIRREPQVVLNYPLVFTECEHFTKK